MIVSPVTDRNRLLTAIARTLEKLGVAIHKLAFWIRYKKSAQEDTITFADRRDEYLFRPGMMIVVSSSTGEEPDRSLN